MDDDFHSDCEMADFCIATIRPEAGLRPVHGILRARALSVTGDARTAAARIVEEAREEADTLLEAARGEAARIGEAARAAAQQAVSSAEEHALRRAAELLDGIERLRADFLGQAHGVVADLAQALFERLIKDMAPRERIDAALRRIVDEAPRKLVSPVLYVHPDDAALLPGLAWEIKPDPAMERGSCRLEATVGEWSFDFNAAVDALKTAFTYAVHGHE
jgi:flagellar biosynthesis/type III secretory pathway protein FliH